MSPDSAPASMKQPATYVILPLSSLLYQRVMDVIEAPVRVNRFHRAAAPDRK